MQDPDGSVFANEIKAKLSEDYPEVPPERVNHSQGVHLSHTGGFPVSEELQALYRSKPARRTTQYTGIKFREIAGVRNLAFLASHQL